MQMCHAGDGQNKPLFNCFYTIKLYYHNPHIYLEVRGLSRSKVKQYVLFSVVTL